MFIAYITLPTSHVLTRDKTRHFDNVMDAWEWLETQIGKAFRLPGVPLCESITNSGLIYGVTRKGLE